MKRIINFFCVCVVLFIISSGLIAEENFPVLKGPYLDQKPPGMKPEIFAPEIISTSKGREFGITFSPDGKECFFTNSSQNNKIMTTKEVNGLWTKLKTPYFSGKYFDFEPLLTPDGKKLVFGTMRPMPGSKKSPLRQWEVKKIGSVWTDLKPVDSPFKERFVMYLTYSANGNAYFTGEGGIYMSKYLNGKHMEPVILGNNINYLPSAAHPYIAADETYLIYDAHATKDNPDLYISFKKPDGNWTKSINMGEKFNTEKEELCAFVTYDGKYLFFSRITNITGDIYWVDAKVIEELKLKYFK